jgi:quinol monooxygenase YgiN
MPHFVVIAEFKVKPEHMADFLALALDDARCSVAHERGCRTFDVAVDQADPNSVMFYEAYDDQAAFDARLATPHLARFRGLSRLRNGAEAHTHFGSHVLYRAPVRLASFLHESFRYLSVAASLAPLTGGYSAHRAQRRAAFRRQAKVR